MKTLKIFIFIICFASLFSCANDVNPLFVEDIQTSELPTIGELHNQIMANFYDRKLNEKFDVYFNNSMEFRNMNDETSHPLFLQNKELMLEIFHAFVSCIPSEYCDLQEECIEVFDSELIECLNEASVLWYDNEDKGTTELMLMSLKNNCKITESEYEFLINKLHGKNNTGLRNTSDSSFLKSIYDDIFQCSNEFWSMRYNNITRASNNFAYTAVYDAIGGAMGAVLGSGLPVIGNWLLSSALSTVFSYAADVNGGAHLRSTDYSW